MIVNDVISSVKEESYGSVADTLWGLLPRPAGNCSFAPCPAGNCCSVVALRAGHLFCSVPGRESLPKPLDTCFWQLFSPWKRVLEPNSALFVAIFPQISVLATCFSPEPVAKELLIMLNESKHADFIKEYYKTDELSLEAVALKRNWIIRGENPDTERTAIYILKDFRDGRLGKIILDELPE